MSFEEYSKWWAATKNELDFLIADEKKYGKLLDKAKTDRYLCSYLLSGIYAKYSILVQKMGLIFDQMIQPQKREVARKLVDVAQIRLIELNNILRSIDISEYHYLDRSLIEFKLIPHEIEILDTFFYYLREHNLEDLWRRIKAGEKIYVPPPPEPETSQELIIEEVEEERPKSRRQRKKKEIVPIERPEPDKNAPFVTLLQSSERGRQDRLYYGDKRRIAYIKQQFLSNDENEAAATTIQAGWRGHTVREMIKRREKERRLLIGMTVPSYRSQDEFRQLELGYKKRQVQRDERIKEYIETNLSERERIFRVRGPGLLEDISDEIREWFHLFYDKTKSFQPIPPAKDGGTILVVRGETLTPEEWMKQQSQKPKKKDKKDKEKEKQKREKLKQEKKKKAKEEAAKKKKELKRKKQLIAKGQFELDLIPTTINELYEEGDKEYRYLWTEKKDEDNPKENIYLDLIQEQKYYELQLEMRPIVDELMEIELELLLKAWAKDNKKKYKKKKKKKNKKKKKGKKKDIFDKRTIEDLFQELVDVGIVHQYQTARLTDFKGDLSYKNWDLRQQDYDPPATLGDVRQVIKINCILPLNVTTMKKPRSVLICAGYNPCGKHLLANAIFTETRCILFDLSPEILAGKYQKKKELKQLLQLVLKVSKLFQPSIIFIDGVERLFYKKVPAAEKPLEPKKISKQLYKGLVKPLRPEDRVMVLGVTARPWLAKVKKLIKSFERIIPIPRPDYNSIVLYLTDLLMSYHGVDRNFNISSLATVIVNIYPLPIVRDVIQSVLTPTRIISLSYNPLTQQEIFEVFINTPTINEKEYRKYEKFWMKTPVGKDRKVLNKFNDKKREDEKKAAMKQR